MWFRFRLDQKKISIKSPSIPILGALTCKSNAITVINDQIGREKKNNGDILLFRYECNLIRFNLVYSR